MTSTRKQRARGLAHDIGQNTIYIVVAVLAIIALCLYIFGRTRGG
jgi:hypothetical protein